MTTATGVLAVVLVGVASGAGVAAFDGSGYARSVDAVVDSATGDVTYALHWSVEGDRIRVALDVATTGWVGFGIGEQASGGMKGADIVYGWVSGSEATVVDAHAVDTVKPTEDCTQDWTVEGFSEADGRTVLELSRDLVTENDLHDRPLVDDGTPTKVLLAWGADGDDSVKYHGSKAYSIEVEIFKSEAELEAELDTIAEIAAAEGVSSFMVRNEDYSVPDVVTDYRDYCVTIPVDAHAVAFEAVVEDEHPELVHHFTLYGNTEACDSVTNDMEGVMLWAWGPGAPNFVAPEGTGFAVGTWVTHAYRSFTLQTHFHNPERLEDVVDNSGIRVYYMATDESLDEIGVYQLGDPNVRLFGKGVGDNGAITQYQFECPASCTAGWSHSITVFGAMLHMHAVGRAMRTELIDADGVTVGDGLGRVDFWDFNFHSFVPFSPPRVVDPGTGMRTTCMYNGDGSTRFGLRSDDEMCINFVFYYPRLTGAGDAGFDRCGLGSCGSVEDDFPAVTDAEITGWGGEACSSEVVPSGEDSDGSSIRFGHGRGLPGLVLAALTAAAAAV